MEESTSHNSYAPGTRPGGRGRQVFAAARLTSCLGQVVADAATQGTFEQFTELGKVLPDYKFMEQVLLRAIPDPTQSLLHTIPAPHNPRSQRAVRLKDRHCGEVADAAYAGRRCRAWVSCGSGSARPAARWGWWSVRQFTLCATVHSLEP